MSELSDPWSRRGFVRLAGVLAGGAALGLAGQPLAGAAPLSPADTPVGAAGRTDWSRAVVEATLTRFPDPAGFAKWSYPQGLYLYGQYQVYRRTKEQRYLRYLKDCVDLLVSPDGVVNNSFDSLDSMRCGTLLLVLHEEFGEDRYRLAAERIRARLDTYPRTSDGGFWHAAKNRDHQLWADGVYMVLPFLVGYGRLFDDAEYANTEAVNQLVTYAKHLTAPNGLLRHAYDESGAQSWADPVTHQSAEHWARAIGWYAMTCVDVLDVLPAGHPGRAKVITVLRGLVAALARYQDPATGRWFQVVDKGDLAGNWTETSASAMYTYAIATAVRRGYVSPGYWSVAARGYRGVLDKASFGTDGLANVDDICVGTNVGDLPFYLARPRATNDLHGLGAFLLMNERLTT